MVHVTWPTAQRRADRSATADKPLRDELLSIEGVEERASGLAAKFTTDPNPRRRARDTFPRFEDNVRVLRAAYRTLADDVRRGHFVVSAADWLLDNFYLIAAEISDIRRNLPRTYLQGLPTIASREHCGQARIYAIAIELIRQSDSRYGEHYTDSRERRRQQPQEERKSDKRSEPSEDTEIQAPAPVVEDKTPATVFIFKDGHQLETKNYAIMGGTLFDFSSKILKKIQLDEIDSAATLKANDDRGVVMKLN